MNISNGLRVFAGLVLAVSVSCVSGCGSPEAGLSSDSTELEAFVAANPEVANADMEPPADPE